MTKFFFKSKILIFVHFPNFGGKKGFSKNSSSDMHNLIRALCQNSEKHNNPIPRRLLDRNQYKRMVRPYFIGPFGYCWGSNKYNYSRFVFENQRYKLQFQSNQKYCITVSMQKIRSISKLILKIHQILGSSALNGFAHFWLRSPKNYWNDI